MKILQKNLIVNRRALLLQMIGSIAGGFITKNIFFGKKTIGKPDLPDEPIRIQINPSAVSHTGNNGALHGK